MVKRLSWTFWVCVPIGLGLIGVAALVVTWGQGLRHDFDRERVTPLAVVECDLSRPGAWEFPVRVEYPAGHGLKLLVEGPAPMRQAWETENWLQGLAGEVTVLSGPFVPEKPVPLMEYVSFASGPDSRAIVRVWGSPPGEYRLRLTVTRGAAGLAGVGHRLLIFNDVCGCELLAVFWGDVIAAGMGLAGLTLGAIGVAARRKSGRIGTTGGITP